MTITEHKRLVAAIPEDLRKGEEIEVSGDGKNWSKARFVFYDCGFVEVEPINDECLVEAYVYARRPAAEQKKRLKDEQWPKDYKWRAVDADGWARYFSFQPSLGKKGWYVMGMSQPYASSGYDSTDWQNSLERRPE